jgi:hypothetical protein
MLLLFGNIVSLILIVLFFRELDLRGKLILSAIVLFSFLLPGFKPTMGTDGISTSIIGFVIRIFLGLCYLIKQKMP